MKLHPMALVFASSAVMLSCGGSSNHTALPTTPTNTVPSSVQALQSDSAYSISVFAKASGDLTPDDMVQTGSNVWVEYQDPHINPDGTLASGVTSAQAVVVEYDLSGNVVQTINVPGHPDGMVVHDASTIWVSTNEDANPQIITINTSTYATNVYTPDVAQLPHGGGLDDMKLVNGVVYASASNPNLTTSPTPNLAPYSTDWSGSTAINGVNTGPTVYAVSLNSDGKTFHSTAVLNSNTPATMLPAGTAITLNMTDTDSSAIDPNGNLVVDSQQDSELVFISNIGSSGQKVSVLPLTLYGNPWPVDDTRWSPASGSSFMLLSDAPGQLVYRIDYSGGFPASTAYSAGQGTLLQTNTSTGVMTPVYVGMKNPHGIIFVTQ